MINYFSEDVAMPDLDMAKIDMVISKVISDKQFLLGELNYIFCSDLYLLEINLKYLNHDYFTDIITFDYSENKFTSGDVFISLERVLENSRNYKCSFVDELKRVMIHGVLHLVKYNDKTDDEQLIMTQMEDFYLKLL